MYVSSALKNKALFNVSECTDILAENWLKNTDSNYFAVHIHFMETLNNGVEMLTQQWIFYTSIWKLQTTIFLYHVFKHVNLYTYLPRFWLNHLFATKWQNLSLVIGISFKMHSHSFMSTLNKQFQFLAGITLAPNNAICYIFCRNVLTGRSIPAACMK